MRVLVTGGAGFIGSHYVRTMLTGGFPGFGDARVTVLDKLSYAGSTRNLAPVADHPGLRFVRADICEPGELAGIVPGHDYVVNFAAETHVDRSIGSAAPFVATNVAGVQHLAQACLDAGVRCLVHVSTDEVYGSVPAGSADEDAPIRPTSPYAASKAAGELLALAYARTHGLDVRITRGCNAYGPYQYPEKLIPLFVTSLIEGRQVPLYGDGGNIRNWLHAEDHCAGIQTALTRGEPGGVYNLGGGSELTNNELTGLLLERCGAGRDMVRRVADRKAHDFRYSIDDTRLRGLGYVPRVPLDSGLTETVRWYQDNRDWWQQLRARAADSGRALRVAEQDGH